MYVRMCVCDRVRGKEEEGRKKNISVFFFCGVFLFLKIFLNFQKIEDVVEALFAFLPYPVLPSSVYCFAEVDLCSFCPYFCIFIIYVSIKQ